MDRDNLIEYISKQYKVKKESDSVYIIFDGVNTYTLSMQCPSTFLGDSSQTTTSTPFLHRKLGSDDIAPDFNPSINKKGQIQGMFPNFGNNQKPMYQNDPTCPGKKKTNFPDPDNFDPGPNLEQYD